MATEFLKDLPILLFEDAKLWEAWLNKNYAQTSGVWLKIAKKSAKTPSVTYNEALNIALCYGWIDGQKNGYDADYFLQRFTQRRAKSIWSKRNIGLVSKLIAAGKMQAPGLVQIEAAKKDGRWERAYDSAREVTMPEDFKKALNQNPKAKQTYESLNKTNTYAFLWRIQTAKKPETRQARIAQFIELLNKGKSLH